MRPLLPALALLVACAPDPMSNHAPTFDQSVAGFRDAKFDACSHDALDALVAEMDPDRALLGCAVAVARSSTGVVYVGTSGYTQHPSCGTGNAKGFTGYTRGAVGSISKSLTAVALLRLWEEGHLGLDPEGGTDLTKYKVGQFLDLDGALFLPDWLDDVTLHQLLTHTGIHAEDEGWDLFVGVDDDDEFEFASLLTSEGVRWDELLPLMDNLQGPVLDRLAEVEQRGANPGSLPEVAIQSLRGPAYPPLATGYSNVGYGILAAIIDKVVTSHHEVYGQDFEGVPGYESWVWWVWNGEGVLDPIGPTSMALNHGWREDVDGVSGLAKDHYPTGQGCTPAHDWAFGGWESGSGGWTMTVGDLARVGLAVDKRSMLQPATWALALTRHSNVRGGYGYGFQLPDEPADGQGQVFGDPFRRDPPTRTASAMVG